MISNTYQNTYYKKNITIPLTIEERDYYKKIFTLLDYEEKGKIEKELIYHFVKDSGLNYTILNQILLLNYQKDKNYFDKNEFYILLRLIAMAQNKIPASLDMIENKNLKLHLPVFHFLQKSNLLKKNYLFDISEDESKSYLNIFYEKKDTRKKYISKLSAILFWNEKNPKSIKDNEKIMESLKPLEKEDYLNIKEFIIGCYLVHISRIIKMPIKLPNIVLQYLGRIPKNNFKNKINKIFNSEKYGKMNTNISRNDFLFFQNEVFKDIKELEKKINEKINTISTNINSNKEASDNNYSIFY